MPLDRKLQMKLITTHFAWAAILTACVVLRCQMFVPRRRQRSAVVWWGGRLSTNGILEFRGHLVGQMEILLSQTLTLSHLGGLVTVLYEQP